MKGASLRDHATRAAHQAPTGLGHSAGIVSADDYDDDEDWGCYECGGEGFVSNCVEEWACIDPEYGCDYCTHRCSLCTPAKPDDPLRQVLADALNEMEASDEG